MNRIKVHSTDADWIDELKLTLMNDGYKASWPVKKFNWRKLSWWYYIEFTK